MKTYQFTDITDNMNLKEILIQQKHEQEQHIRDPLVLRSKTSEVSSILSSPLIKVITGPRRAGKSSFCFQLLHEKHFAYLNFDDDQLVGCDDTSALLSALAEVYPDAKYYFFDEIQNFEKWELLVNKLARRGYNLIITGSNAHMLSSELATALTGRHHPIEILPFSFEEFLQFHKVKISKDSLSVDATRGQLLQKLQVYLESGGFPEVTVYGLEPHGYLQTLWDAVLFKDIVRRRKIKYGQKVYDLALHLLSSVAARTTANSSRAAGNIGSIATAQNYLSFLEEAYLLFFLPAYASKTKERQTRPRKCYAIDTGFVLSKIPSSMIPTARLFENLIALALRRMGNEPAVNLFYYITHSGKEVDFLIKEGTKIKTLIQVSHSFTNDNTRNRELASLLEASSELKCNNLVVITWNTKENIKMDGKTIRVLPLIDWCFG